MIQPSGVGLGAKDRQQDPSLSSRTNRVLVASRKKGQQGGGQAGVGRKWQHIDTLSETRKTRMSQEKLTPGPLKGKAPEAREREFKGAGQCQYVGWGDPERKPNPVGQPSQRYSQEQTSLSSCLHLPQCPRVSFQSVLRAQS